MASDTPENGSIMALLLISDISENGSVARLMTSSIPRSGLSASSIARDAVEEKFINCSSLDQGVRALSSASVESVVRSGSNAEMLLTIDAVQLLSYVHNLCTRSKFHRKIKCDKDYCDREELSFRMMQRYL
jgi:hypothetical protein